MSVTLRMKCEVCGKPKGRWADHSSCSVIKKSMHSTDKKKQVRPPYSAKDINWMCERDK